ncbi:alpha/beta hydrolase fold domain-containing protein [Nocardioides sp. MAH-18]|uniref:Alpha/beta hydrolase fold domain-containing protein n=1 Tax=Nocardioides agri TaxID=2682843 RepID=A0A6L6XTP9_9ACTN|nr:MULTISPECIES: alpha/beta hydrolase fold domain-containing protein [unclassified Nocardioides]MBA2955301.1 alpha/beta hydrolase [Nocardioides sp. CGMCC 1.13656]MVQ50152.1 alpha/beta hydrolase fold domain-containing protein [Nocardioides sp. MAH-18]
MSLHPSYVERFPLLDGIDSFEQLMGDPALEDRFHAFMQWRDATPPPAVDAEDGAVPGPHGPVPARIYTPAGGTVDRPCLVWMHGGAFMGGDLDMPEADRTAREVCDRAGAVVVSVDYRLAVDGVHYPVPLDDVVAVVRWVRDEAAGLGVDAARITVGGASAGGNLATGAVLRVRDEDSWLPALLAPAYGVFHPVLPPVPAEVDALLASVPPMLRFTAEGTAGITANYLGASPDSADGYAMPALADLAGLCPVLMVDAEGDDLRGSEEPFARQLTDAGVPLRRHVVPGVMHGFLNLPADIEPVGGAFQLIADAVAAPVLIA